MGRHAKPAVIKELEGNRSKVAQSTLTNTPKISRLPRCPEHLCDEEKRLWRDMVECMPFGLLSRADEGALERYVVAWHRFRVTAQMMRLGEVPMVISNNVGWVRHPVLVANESASKEMAKAGAELGFSPAARARMTSPDFADDDPMSALLGNDGPNGAWQTARREDD